jgi:hypothetical protein
MYHDFLVIYIIYQFRADPNPGGNEPGLNSDMSHNPSFFQAQHHVIITYNIYCALSGGTYRLPDMLTYMM